MQFTIPFGWLPEFTVGTCLLAWCTISYAETLWWAHCQYKIYGEEYDFVRSKYDDSVVFMLFWMTLGAPLTSFARIFCWWLGADDLMGIKKYLYNLDPTTKTRLAQYLFDTGVDFFKVGRHNKAENYLSRSIKFDPKFEDKINMFRRHGGVDVWRYMSFVKAV